MKIQHMAFSIILMTSAPAAMAFKGDAAAGEAKSVTCAACHGKDGNSVIAINPSLAGQNYSYLVQALRDYRSGARNNPIMKVQAAPLKDEDIENLAKYFSTQPGKLKSLSAR
ncbi:MAG: cytochrome c [Gammaproteobacteria bacterium]|nr:cytochrome c [Gammaproteobacteria bacterium]